MAEEEVAGTAQPPLVSGVAIPFAIPPALDAVRRRWDRAAGAGARPHVTILFPFLPCSTLDGSVRTELAAIAQSVATFSVRFDRVRRFESLVWIEPDPAAAFASMTAAVAARWPDFPPYGGEFETVIPHLTVVESPDAPLDAVEAVARQAVPFTRRAERLELWCQDAAGRWHPRWRMRFGARP